MSAYASSVTSTMIKAVKVDSVKGIGLFVGQCDITNYNSTLVEITAITGKFRTMLTVVAGVSDNGYLVQWDSSDEAFKAYYPVTAHAHDFKVESSGTIGSNMTLGLSSDSNSATLEGGSGITAPRTLSTSSPVQAATASAGSEVANDVDVGEVEFIAYGLI